MPISSGPLYQSSSSYGDVRRVLPYRVLWSKVRLTALHNCKVQAVIRQYQFWCMSCKLNFAIVYKRSRYHYVTYTVFCYTIHTVNCDGIGRTLVCCVLCRLPRDCLCKATFLSNLTGLGMNDACNFAPTVAHTVCTKHDMVWWWCQLLLCQNRGKECIGVS